MMDKIETLASSHMPPNQDNPGVHKLDPYQQCMAAMISFAGELAFAEIPSGSGKTIVMLFSALICLFDKGLQSVTFITSSKMLMNQLKDEIT